MLPCPFPSLPSPIHLWHIYVKGLTFSGLLNNHGQDCRKFNFSLHFPSTHFPKTTKNIGFIFLNSRCRHSVRTKQKSGAPILKPYHIATLRVSWWRLLKQRSNGFPRPVHADGRCSSVPAPRSRWRRSASARSRWAWRRRGCQSVRDAGPIGRFASQAHSRDLRWERRRRRLLLHRDLPRSIEGSCVEEWPGCEAVPWPRCSRWGWRRRCRPTPGEWDACGSAPTCRKWSRTTGAAHDTCGRC